MPYARVNVLSGYRRMRRPLLAVLVVAILGLFPGEGRLVLVP